MNTEGSCRGGGGYTALEGGGGCGGCRCAARRWREARWERHNKLLLEGGQELTHERGMRVSQQALRTGQWGVKVSVPAEMMSSKWGRAWHH